MLQVEVTEFSVHDVVAGEELLLNGDGRLLLGDAAYDSHRLRGIVEGIFGAGEVRYGNRTRCRLVLFRILFYGIMKQAQTGKCLNS